MTNQPSRVFLLEPVRQDVSAALEHGAMHVVFDPQDERPSIWHSSFPSRAVDLMERAGYCPGVDFFLAAGSMPTVTMVLGELFSRHGRARVLLFDAPGCCYKDKLLGCHD